METENTETQNVSIHPIWKQCLQNMKKDGIEYGKQYTAEYFEKELRANRKDMKFGLMIAEIRRQLEHDGYYLSGKGGHGNMWVIVMQQQNVNVMYNYQSKAIDALKRGVILGTNTRLDLLDEQDRRRHESMLEKIAMRSALVTRRITKTSTKLLK
jgi:hypothetical protein